MAGKGAGPVGVCGFSLSVTAADGIGTVTGTGGVVTVGAAGAGVVVAGVVVTTWGLIPLITDSFALFADR